MVSQWKRIIANATAAQNSADTTVTQIGSGIVKPSWAKSVLQAIVNLGTITMTTAEDISGYFKVWDDSNIIDPLYYPLPVIPANLAGAAAGQMNFPVSVPVMQNIPDDDTVKISFAFDAATTGVHVVDGFLLFSDKQVPLRLHAQTMAATAVGDALAESAEVTIDTSSGKTSALLGIWGYSNIGGTAVAAEGTEVYARIKANLVGWQENQIALNVHNASLGNDSYSITQPVVYNYLDNGLERFFDGFHRRILGDTLFPVSGKQTFTVSAHNARDVNDNIDSIFRIGLIWKE